jgi:hypothetical protein
MPTMLMSGYHGGHAEPVIGRRFAPTRWLCPPYDFGFSGQVRERRVSKSASRKLLVKV